MWRGSEKKAAAPPCTVAEGQAYSGSRRYLTVELVVVGYASFVLFLLALPIWGTDGLIGDVYLAGLFGALVAIAAVLVLWIRSVSAVSVQVDGLTLALARPGLRFEIPCDAIDEITPWSLPLPDSGLYFRMRSGRHVRYGVALSDPLPVLEALAGVGGVEAAARIVDHPSVVYANARAARRKGWAYLFVKFVVFSFLLVVFGLYLDWNAVEGALAMSWIGMAAFLILYACVWRVLAEMVCLAAAWLLERVQAGRVRSIAEIVCAGAYYIGAPLLLYVPL